MFANKDQMGFSIPKPIFLWRWECRKSRQLRATSMQHRFAKFVAAYPTCRCGVGAMTPNSISQSQRTSETVGTGENSNFLPGWRPNAFMWRLQRNECTHRPSHPSPLPTMGHDPSASAGSRRHGNKGGSLNDKRQTGQGLAPNQRCGRL